MNEPQTKGENITVVLRIKPEKNICELNPIKITDSTTIMIPSKKKNYKFNYIGGENSTQDEIFENCAKKLCDHALKGYNCTIFAYGQTGSGKTYTILGKNITENIGSNDTDIIMKENNSKDDCFEYDKNDEKIGLVSRIIYYLFNNSSDKNTDNKFCFKISFMELYNEKIIDLLNSNNKNYSNRLILKNLTKLVINSPIDAMNYIINGNHSRHTSSTSINDESSRSHAIITIYIENSSSKENKRKKCVFHIIDLAGTERQKKTNTTGERTIEAGANNKSLFALGNVIRAIIKNKENKEFIPYRDSLLTLILKYSIGGNSKTSIIATISQLKSNSEETNNTLEFTQNAKKIKNKPKINEEYIKTIEDNKKIVNLTKINNSLKEKCQQLENNQRITLNEKESLSKILEKQSEEIKKLINDLKEKEAKFEEENKKLNDKIEKDDFDIIDYKYELNDLNDKNNNLQEENKNLNEKNDKLQEENTNLKNIIEKYSNDLNNLNEKNDKLQEENTNLKYYANEFDNIKTELEYKIISLNEEMENYNRTFKIIDEKHKNEISDLQNKNKKLEEEKSENHSLKDKLQKEIIYLKDKIEKYNFDIKRITNELNELKTENNKQKEENKKLEVENKNLSDVINNYENKIKTITGELNEAKTDKNKFHEENKNLTDIINNHGNKIKNITNELNELKNKYNKLFEENKNLKKENNECQSNIKNLKEEIESKNEIIKINQSDLENMDKELKNLQEKNRKYEQQQDSIKIELYNYKIKESEQNKNIKKMEKQIEELKRTKEQLSENNESSQKIINEYLDDIHLLKKGKTNLEKNINTLTNNLSNLLASPYFDHGDCIFSINRYNEMYQIIYNFVFSNYRNNNLNNNIQYFYELGKSIIDNKIKKLDTICNKLYSLCDSANERNNN